MYTEGESDREVEERQRDTKREIATAGAIAIACGPLVWDRWSFAGRLLVIYMPAPLYDRLHVHISMYMMYTI